MPRRAMSCRCSRRLEIRQGIFCWNLATADPLTHAARAQPGPGGLARRGPSTLSDPCSKARGSTRIKSYVARLPLTQTVWGSGRVVARQPFPARSVPALTPSQRLVKLAQKQIFRESGRQDHSDYDPKSRSAARCRHRAPAASLMGAVDALPHVPLLIIRGANSDLLSAATVEANAARRRQWRRCSSCRTRAMPAPDR
jgi:hypothetical protein